MFEVYVNADESVVCSNQEFNIEREQVIYHTVAGYADYYDKHLLHSEIAYPIIMITDEEFPDEDEYPDYMRCGDDCPF